MTEITEDGVPTVDGKTEAQRVHDVVVGSYQNSPLVRILASLVLPAGVGTTLSEHVERIARQRKLEFLDELSKGEAQLTEELIQSDDFLHAFFIASAAAVRSRREEKVRTFARLLIKEAPHLSESDYEIELYEEAVRVIEQLSLLDVKLLITYYQQSPAVKPGRAFKLRPLPTGAKHTEFTGALGRDRTNRLEGLGLLRKETRVVEQKSRPLSTEEVWYFTALFGRIVDVLQDFAAAPSS